MKNLSRKQYKNLKKIFVEVAGHDALIDKRELGSLLAIDNSAILNRIFSIVDEDKSGFIDRNEFMRFAQSLCDAEADKRIQFAFKLYDANDDGRIHSQEFEDMLTESLKEQGLTIDEELLEDLVDSFFAEADLNNDGYICEQEFKKILEKYPSIGNQVALHAVHWLSEGREKRITKKPHGNRLGYRLGRAWVNQRSAFIWSLIYIACNAFLFVNAMYKYDAMGASIVVQIARGGGACLNFNGALVLIPTLRVLWTWVRTTRFEKIFPVDSMIDFHMVIGRALVLFSVIHIVAHLLNYWQTKAIIWQELFTTQVGLTGLLLTVTLVVIWRFARTKTRKSNKFEWFAESHSLYSLWIVALLIHGPVFWKWFAFPAFLFIVDRTVRLFGKKSKVKVLEITPLAHGVTRLKLEKPKVFNAQAGDYLFLKIPELSKSEWHPFTISSAPENKNLELHVRSQGDWTGALHNVANRHQHSPEPIVARIDGPYGTPSSSAVNEDVVVLVAAGIGVTPFASILQSRLINQKHNKNSHVYFYWINRSQRCFEWFIELLSEMDEKFDKDKLSIRIYLSSVTHDMTNAAMQIALECYFSANQRDAVSGLQAAALPGKPNWDEECHNIATRHQEEGVSVFYCGPQGPGKTLRKYCRKHGLLFREEKF